MRGNEWLPYHYISAAGMADDELDEVEFKIDQAEAIRQYRQIESR